MVVSNKLIFWAFSWRGEDGCVTGCCIVALWFMPSYVSFTFNSLYLQLLIKVIISQTYLRMRFIHDKWMDIARDFSPHLEYLAMHWPVAELLEWHFRHTTERTVPRVSWLSRSLANILLFLVQVLVAVHSRIMCCEARFENACSCSAHLPSCSWIKIAWHSVTQYGAGRLIFHVGTGSACSHARENYNFVSQETFSANVRPIKLSIWFNFSAHFREKFNQNFPRDMN